MCSWGSPAGGGDKGLETTVGDSLHSVNVLGAPNYTPGESCTGKLYVHFILILKRICR